MKKKFLSRKFLLTLIGDILGILTMIIGQTTVTTLVGAVAVIAVNVVYCIVEGMIDAKSVGQIADAAEDIAESLGASSTTVEMIDRVGDVVEEVIGKGGAIALDESK